MNLPMMELTTTEPIRELANKDKEEKLRIRAVHAVMMRWVVEGVTVDEILREQPLTLQEFAAQRRVKDVFDAKGGSQASIKALDRLIVLIDGDGTEDRPKSPVTLIERHIESPTGEVTKVKEVRQSVQLITEGNVNE